MFVMFVIGMEVEICLGNSSRLGRLDERVWCSRESRGFSGG